MPKCGLDYLSCIGGKESVELTPTLVDNFPSHAVKEPDLLLQHFSFMSHLKNIKFTSE